MEIDKVALDRYITTPPEDNSTYFEAVYDAIPLEILSQEQYEANEEMLDELISILNINYLSVSDCASIVIEMIEKKIIILK